MPANAAFNVLAPEPGVNVFVHKATPANTFGNYTFIANPRANGNRHALVFTTLNWNPGGGSGIYNNRVTGVYYVSNRWTIFNQDTAATPPNASFNVYVVANRAYLPAIQR